MDMTQALRERAGKAAQQQWAPGAQVTSVVPLTGGASSLTFIAEMTGAYHLTDRGAGAEVSYELTVDVRIPTPGLLKRKAEKMIIDTALKGLKARAETLADGGNTGGTR